MADQDGWAPEAPEIRKASGRYVQPKNWPEVTEGKRKFQQFRLRFLSRMVVGIVIWGEDGKPHRFRTEGEIPAGFKPRIQDKGKHKGKPELPKVFYAGAVWSYEGEGDVLVYEITQETVYNPMFRLAKQWGSPTGYDFIVERAMVDGFWEYTVTNCPPSAVPDKAIAAFADIVSAGFDLNRLFDGGDPFSAPAAEAVPAAPVELPF